MRNLFYRIKIKNIYILSTTMTPRKLPRSAIKYMAKETNHVTLGTGVDKTRILASN